MRTDRRQIASLLLPFFPAMSMASSDEWHGFLNEITGLAIDRDEMNSTAFDKWREAIAEQHGLPVWVSKPRIDEIAKRSAEMLAKEADRQKCQDKLLTFLARVAPTKTVADLIKDAKAAVK